MYGDGGGGEREMEVSNKFQKNKPTRRLYLRQIPIKMLIITNQLQKRQINIQTPESIPAPIHGLSFLKFISIVE